VRDPNAFGAQDRFYSDPKMRAAYRAHVERIVSRTNQVTGIPYRDDPTILAWELMNESAVSTAAGAEARLAWVSEMAKVIHGLDQHHLVTPGVSVYRTESERRDWLAVCKLPEVDYCDAHIYPEDLLRNRDAALLEPAIDDFVQLAHHVAGKPLVLGEFGIHGNEDGTWENQPRGYWMGRILERLRFDGAAGGIVWLYQPENGADKRHGISVGAKTAEGPRSVIRAAARQPNMPDDAVNPDLGPHVGEVPLMPLHGEFVGKGAIVPQLPERASGGERVTWDPGAYERAAWEATGLYDGGVLAHVWGTETGWFEYTYEIVPAEVKGKAGQNGRGGQSGKDGKDSGRPISPLPPSRTRLPYALTVRARVSSEFPGTQSPPDGVSEFAVTLDGASVGTATAVRDDGKGAWVQLRTTNPDVLHGALSPGKHRLRFVVAAGEKAHGLCIYGKPGEKGGAAGRTGPIELKIDR
jgi:mannan endo-1,4-beta-mannosidase